MLTRNYLYLRNELRNYVDNDLSISASANLMTRFSYASANLRHFLPQLIFNDHVRIFKEILFHQRVSLLEQEYLGILDFITPEGLTEDLFQFIKQTPVIFCTFHLGSYRVVNTFLAHHNIPFSLVISNDVMQQQSVGYKEGYEKLYNGYLFEELSLINAETPQAGLQMMRDLKKGKSLLIYIDGNTGAIKDDHEKSSMVSLLKGSIYAKNGVAFMSHAAKVPIIPVVCYRKGLDDIRLRFFDVIYPNLEKNRQEQAHELTQLLYDRLGSVLTEYADQWEAWLYLQKDIANKAICTQCNSIKKCDVDFDSLDLLKFGLIKVGSEFKLLDKTTYKTVETDKKILDKLYQQMINC